MLTASLASSAKTLRHFDDRFPEVLTGEDAAEGCRDMLYALDDVHFEFHASFPEPSSQLFLHLPQKMLPGGVAVRQNGDVHADNAVEILHSIALVVRDVILRHHPST